MCKEIPLTLWHSPLGMRDSFDFATRGYLKALKSIGAEGIRIPPYSSIMQLDTEKDADLESLLDFIKPPKEAQMPPLKRVEAGDIRIGGSWVVYPKTDEKGQARPINVPICEGSVDLGARQQRYSNPKVVVRNIVIHHDPSSIARTHMNLIRGGKPDGVRYFGITVWETSMIPDGIARVLSELDGIIVPSVHSLRALEGSGVDTKLAVVPHTFSEEQWPKPSNEELMVRERPKFVFYFVGSCIERKNIKGLIRCYLKAFPARRDVVLRIKTSGYEDEIEEIYNQAAEESKIAAVDLPEIAIFTKSWPQEKMRAFHLDGDCFVSATRGEGFGLCEMEAKLCCRPVITTGWGACVEVMSVFDRLVDYEMQNVHGMYNIGCYESDQLWANPKDHDLILKMRQAFQEGPIRDSNGWDYMHSRFNRSIIGFQLKNAFESFKM